MGSELAWHDNCEKLHLISTYLKPQLHMGNCETASHLWEII